MPTLPVMPRWFAPVLFAAGLAALYSGALRTGFLNDDYLFLEEARRHGWHSLLGTGGALANYFRPLSRQCWFALFTPLAGSQAWPFHAAHFALFLGSCALLHRFLREQTSSAGAWLGTLYFATLPLQRVNLTWISCNQDLLALTATLAAFAAWRANRTALAALAYLAALLSKETAAPLPVALFAWSVWREGRDPRDTLRALLPFALPLTLWGAGELWLRGASVAPADLRFGAGAAFATLVHLAQSLVGLEAPSAIPQAFAAARPSLLALAALALVALTWQKDAPEGAPHASLARFGVAWAVLFAVPAMPLAHTWSAYYFTLSAAGAALLVALACRQATRWTWSVAVLGLLFWHAVVSASPSFAVTEHVWNTTSHLTAHYFERGAQLSAQLRAALKRVEPKPAPHTRFWFATLPPYAGFQMGNGAGIRDLYRDTTLESHFYSQYSESTAASHPAVFLYWNGVDFERLYEHSADPLFQVGGDLLLLDRPEGASWALRRALDSGETPQDVLPWLGWAYLWSGRRDEAEAAWAAFGAKDDTTAYVAWLRAARTALDERDTTATRRALFEAMRRGIGRPEAHAVLGELLHSRSPKFALLETKVATRLSPEDWLARRDLVSGLLDARLDAQAETELAALRRIHPDYANDLVAAQLERTLATRRGMRPAR